MSYNGEIYKRKTQLRKEILKMSSAEERAEKFIELYLEGLSLKRIAAVFQCSVNHLVDLLKYFNVKRCIRCNQLKSRSDFCNAQKYPDGKNIYCNECKKNQRNSRTVEKREQERLYMQEYYTDNKEKFQESFKQYNIKNRDKLLQKHKDYYYAKKDELNKRRAQHYKDKPELRKAVMKRHHKKHKDYYRCINARRRAAKLQATVSWSNAVEIKKVYSEASKLQGLDGVMRHVDHIVPLIHDEVCGLHVEYNLRILTEFENCSKNNKFNVGISMKELLE